MFKLVFKLVFELAFFFFLPYPIYKCRLSRSADIER